MLLDGGGVVVVLGTVVEEPGGTVYVPLEPSLYVTTVTMVVVSVFWITREELELDELRAGGIETVLDGSYESVVGSAPSITVVARS